jgi:DNA polymerase II
MQVQFRTKHYNFPLQEGDNPAFWLKTALQKHDPDILVTDYGDTWLLDTLLESVHQAYDRLPLSRDPDHPVNHIREKSYFSYGQVIYRGQQVHLFGRAHIDRRNTMMWSDYGLEGILENARVTALPIQTSARVSPGTGISGMQMIVALQTGVLVPWHKQQAERPKTAVDLIHADSGGLVYQPLLGLHRDVGEIDFVSLYPAVMVRCNISPEKKPITLADPPAADPGLIPLTLAPLLKKRVTLKNRVLTLARWDSRRPAYKARASAEKWLLVVCFGYLGYRNARFGRIESHEAVTAGGREALMLAKEAAEDSGFEILHMFVDALWVQKDGCKRVEDYQPLLEEIYQRTGIQIALDGIYRWVAFLPSRVNGRVPVGNRYFGVFQDGTIKIRGLEARRRDSPPWVIKTQTSLIEYLAQAPEADQLPDYLPGAFDLLQKALSQLKAGQVPLEDLLLAQRMSRELTKYTDPSPAARAALQLETVGKSTQAGQRVRFLLTRGKPGVWAWDLPGQPDPRTVDVAAYTRLMLRAVENVLQPLGVTREELKLWAEGKAAAEPLKFACLIS